jgi:hypothetical protein
VSTDARAVHLLPAGELFEQGYPSTSVAVCGELVTSAPDGDEEDPGYCGDCVHAAIQWEQGARSYLDDLAATVELAGARSALRVLLTLADDAPTLTDEELRSRLTALAGRFSVMGSQ